MVIINTHQRREKYYIVNLKSVVKLYIKNLIDNALSFYIYKARNNRNKHYIELCRFYEDFELGKFVFKKKGSLITNSEVSKLLEIRALQNVNAIDNTVLNFITGSLSILLEDTPRNLKYDLNCLISDYEKILNIKYCQNIESEILKIEATMKKIVSK